VDEVRTRGEARREQLLDAADRAVRRSGATVSMAEIAAEAGVTKPILYRSFADKAGLYRALAERYTGTLLASLQRALATPGTLRDRTSATVSAYLSLVRSEPQAYRFVMAGTGAAEAGVRTRVADFQREVADRLAAGLRVELQRAGRPVREPLPAVWAHAIVGMVQATGDWWLDDPDAIAEARLSRLLVELLDGGLLREAAPAARSPAPPRRRTATTR